MQTGPLVFSVNDDGTVTLRCAADAFFAHADEIYRLLTHEAQDDDGGETEPGGGAPRRRARRSPPSEAASDSEAIAATHVRSLWRELFPEGPRPSRDLGERGAEVLAAAYYLTCQRGFEAVGRGILASALEAAGSSSQLTSSTLVHLARKGWLERVRRGSYRLSQRGLDRVESLRTLAPQPHAQRSAAAAPELPNLAGLSRFLRSVPVNRKWRRVLLVGYFLQEHCGLAEWDQRLIGACFQRLRGVDAPGSLPALISQVLFKRHGLLERGSRRGRYRLSEKAREELRREPRVAEADAYHRAQQIGSMAKTG